MEIDTDTFHRKADLQMGKPTVERRQLGAELRRLREAAGMQQKDAAVAVECDVSQISRVERGDRTFKVLEIEKLLDLYNAPKQSRDETMRLAQIARRRQPRRMYSDGLPGAFRRLSDHEQSATEIYYSEGELIPGLLQTEDYMRALMGVGQSAIFDVSAEDIEARISFRLDRQQLIRREDPPLLWFVIGECALRRPVGRHQVLQDQLQHLLDVTREHRHVVIQVAPLSIVDHPMLGRPITILRFGGAAPDLVYQSTLIGGGVYMDDEKDIMNSSRAFDRLRAVALGPEESQDFVIERMKELKK
jgi:transcriptional regulator with XRE-family HTH domain